MRTLVEWLQSLPGVHDVAPLSVTIKGTTYAAARYRQTVPTLPGCPAYDRGERESTREMIYVLGALPRHYVRRSKAAYTLKSDPREWYIAGYWQGDPHPFNPSADMTSYHPFGAHFLLAPWQVPDSSKIDQHEPRAYDRVELILSP